jgi:hypothetical protein
LLTALLVVAGCAESVPRGGGTEAVAFTQPQPEQRQAWRQIGLRDGGRIGQAYMAARQIDAAAGLRHAWIAIDLVEVIRLPEIGRDARSVLFLAEYRCDRHAWRPLQTVWFQEHGARTALLRETPRGPDELRAVVEGTLTDDFLDAVCAT